jgi:F-type H+-transporting ATPase subunit alpha
VSRFENEFLRLVRAQHQDLLDGIRTGKTLTPELEAKLKSALDNFAKSFA